MIDANPGETPFAGALAGFADILQWNEGDSADAEAVAGLRPHLRCFHASSGGPWPAACSFWGQVYFNTLLIPATCLLASGWLADAHVRRISASFCPGGGAPLRFQLCGERRCETSGEAALVRLLDQHIGCVIDELAGESGLSKRMLWEGVDQTMRWTVAEIAKGQPERVLRLKRLAQSGLRLAFPLLSRRPPATAVRKFCCLRHQLPGQCACLEICPKRKF